MEEDGKTFKRRSVGGHLKQSCWTAEALMVMAKYKKSVLNLLLNSSSSSSTLWTCFKIPVPIHQVLPPWIKCFLSHVIPATGGSSLNYDSLSRILDDAALAHRVGYDICDVRKMSQAECGPGRKRMPVTSKKQCIPAEVEPLEEGVGDAAQISLCGVAESNNTERGFSGEWGHDADENYEGFNTHSFWKYAKDYSHIDSDTADGDQNAAPAASGQLVALEACSAASCPLLAQDAVSGGGGSVRDGESAIKRPRHLR